MRYYGYAANEVEMVLEAGKYGYKLYSFRGGWAIHHNKLEIYEFPEYQEDEAWEKYEELVREWYEAFEEVEE